MEQFNGVRVVKAGDGDDIIRGGETDDELRGGAGNDRISDWNFDRTKDKDILIGGSGNDELSADSGKDVLNGGSGDDVLSGGKGRDKLNDGADNDTLTGGGSGDKFVFKNGFGIDKITDFDANNNLEDINLKAVSSIKGFNDLKSNHMEQVGADVIIDDGSGNQITLLAVDIGDLNKADFIF